MDHVGQTRPDPNSTITANLRFPGQYFDEESGLHYNTFRDYDPQTGRYVQRDMIELWGGVNTFAYVYNNPVNWSDPEGLEKIILYGSDEKSVPLKNFQRIIQINREHF